VLFCKEVRLGKTSSQILKVPFGRQMAVAEGRLAIWSLTVISISHRLAWPLALLCALAFGLIDGMDLSSMLKLKY